MLIVDSRLVLVALLVVLCCSLVAVVLAAVALTKNNESPSINVRFSWVLDKGTFKHKLTLVHCNVSLFMLSSGSNGRRQGRPLLL